MPSTNIVALAGNIGADPEMRYTQSGAAVMNFRMAINERVPVSNARDEWKEITSWINVTCFGRLAENMHPRLHKGSSVFVDGKLHEDQWQAQDGSKRSRIVVRANSLLVGERNPNGNGQTEAQPEDQTDGSELPF